VLASEAHTCWEEALLAGSGVFAQPPSILKFFVHLLQQNHIATLHTQLIISTRGVFICSLLGALVSGG
jgi:hypothetical protein